MDPRPAGPRVGALAALSLLLLPTRLPAQHTGPPVPPKRSITFGETMRDSLARRDLLLSAESTYAQQWSLKGTAGQIVTIDLASEAFDAYAFLLGPGLAQPLQDDDSGGRCNARLTARLPQTGDYIIVVTSSEKRATGPFVLTVTAGAKPKSLTPCPR